MRTRTLQRLSPWALACGLAVVAGPSPAALVARNLDADLGTVEAYFDTVLGVTWLRDAKYLAQVTPSLPVTNYAPWLDADAAINALNGNAAANFGYSGWRMPTASGVATLGGPGCQFGFNGSTDCGSNVDTNSSELAHMFHVNLGNTSSRDSLGNFRSGNPGIDFGLVNAADFLNLETGRYWSSTSSYRLIFNQQNPGFVTFDLADGSQTVTNPGSGSNAARGFAWLVHDGDVGSAVTQVVPEPASWALAGLGLLALTTLRQRRATP